MKYIASCSFGKDSLAMLLILLKENKRVDEVIFYDTEMEFKSIYNNKEKIEKILKEKGIKFTVLKSENTFYYDMLVRPVKYRDKAKGDYHYGYSWCGGTCRWGTANKIKAIKKYYKENYSGEEIFEYVGIAYDEIERANQDPHKIYPLIELKMTEKDCLNYCYSNGYSWNENGVELYSVLDRVSCWCCGNKNLKELKNMYLYLPEYWQKLKGIQSKLDRPIKKNKSVFDLEKEFKNLK